MAHDADYLFALKLQEELNREEADEVAATALPAPPVSFQLISQFPHVDVESSFTRLHWFSFTFRSELSRQNADTSPMKKTWMQRRIWCIQNGSTLIRRRTFIRYSVRSTSNFSRENWNASNSNGANGCISAPAFVIHAEIDWAHRLRFDWVSHCWNCELVETWSKHCW